MGDVFRLQVKDHFDAAHQLKGYNGKCKRLHGHRWDVEVCVEGSELDELNMLIDFVVVKKVMKQLLDNILDHYFLNEVLGENNVTAEFLAKWFFGKFQEGLQASGYAPNQVKLVRVCIWESPDCCVKYSPKMKATGEAEE